MILVRTKCGLDWNLKQDAKHFWVQILTIQECKRSLSKKNVDAVVPTKPKLTRTIKKVIKSPKLLSKGCKNFKKRQPPNDPNLKS